MKSHGRQADHDRRELQRLIRDREFKVVYQPILDLSTGKPFAYEALIRPPKDSIFNNVEKMFAFAEEQKLLWDLEELARSLAFSVLPDLPPSVLLFVNSSPEVICDPRFMDSLTEQLGESVQYRRNRIVIELTELCEPESISDLVERFRLLQELGFQLAIDDVGAGTSGLNRIMRLHPNCLKLDRELVAGVDSDPFRRNLLEFFAHFVERSNIHLIAEGIEYESELKVIIESGVHFGQGYLLGRPQPFNVAVDPIWEERIPYLCEQVQLKDVLDPRLIRLKDLALPLINCPVDASAEEIDSLVNLVQDAAGLALMDGRQVTAYVPMEDALECHRDADSFSIQHLMDHASGGWVVATPQTTVSEGILLSTSRSEKDLSAPILVISDDVVGIVKMHDLYRMAADFQHGTDPHTSLLTGLADRVQIDQEITRRIETVDRASIAFLDLRRLADYNSGYGYEAGDKLIRHLSEMIVAGFLSTTSKFIGHLSDDRFVIISDAVDFHDRLEMLASDFDECRCEFFRSEDVERKNFVGIGTESNHLVPLTSLRILLLPHAFTAFSTTRDIYRTVNSMQALDRARGIGGTSTVVVQTTEEDTGYSVLRRSA